MRAHFNLAESAQNAVKFLNLPYGAKNCFASDCETFQNRIADLEKQVNEFIYQHYYAFDSEEHNAVKKLFT